jgi:two-component system, cell cycle sensor histidine kinase and response regulator CckA
MAKCLSGVETAGPLLSIPSQLQGFGRLVAPSHRVMGYDTRPGSTGTSPIQVLLIEDNVIDARFLSADFQKRGESRFSLHITHRLDAGLQVLRTTPIDVILLDLFLEEIYGLDTLSAVRIAFPDTPVVVLTGLNDEALALQSLKHGAQDYLLKTSADSDRLFRAIYYAIERKQVELDKRSLEERSLQMQKLEALGTLAGGVAHNFNNMLMAIMGHSYLLTETSADEDIQKHAVAIKKAADRASALTRQLLMFSHRETGRLVPVNLNDILRDTEELIRSVAGQRSLLSFAYAQQPALIQADPIQIQHMIMSLVLNAREAIGPAGCITIRTEIPESRSVRLTVSDDGCGMSPETRRHIFEPFYTTRGLAVAAGLGLSAVYGIVKQHGGTIDVDSEIGKGSSFMVTIPTASIARAI